MLKLRENATRIFRSKKNGHSFTYFIDGKVRSFTTHIDDINTQLAAMFGSLNALVPVKSITLQALLLMGMAAMAPPEASALDSMALPTGYQSVSGNHQFNQTPGVLDVTTSAAKSIVNYQTFNIGSNAQVNFNLPSANASILNRVVGGSLSEIYGNMTSNGRVFLVNPAGVFFGNGANVSVNGLVASTLSISDAKFLAGQYEFSKVAGSPSGHIEIEKGATINVLNGGASFIASSFANHGEVTATGGAIQVGVGDRISLGNDLIGMTVDEPLKDTLNRIALLNTGNLTADQVKLIAATVKQSVLDVIVNNAGRIVANRVIDGEGGTIELIADNGIVNNDGILNASGTVGGDILMEGAASQNNGQLLAMGTTGTGGNIHMLGTDFVALINQALVDASGATGGGEILIGGDQLGQNASISNAIATFVGENVLVKADALSIGHGGKVIVWSDEATGFYGHISAKGGSQSGNGGFVETSGKNFLDMKGSVDASAPNGQAGSWLLDPRDVKITNDNDDVFFSFNLITNTWSVSPTSLLFSVSEVKASSVNDALNAGTNVTIHTGNYGTQQGDIRIQSAINKTTGGNATLSLFAADDIIMDPGGSIASSSSNSLNVVLKADNDLFAGSASNGNGDITLNGPINLVKGNVTLSGRGIYLNKDIKTGNGTVDITALGDTIVQAGSGSVLSGNTLNAKTLGSNKNITFTDADFSTATLKTNNGNIVYTDRDGIIATVDAGTATASITAGSGSNVNSNSSETGITLEGTNKASSFTATANKGNISQNSGSKVNISALNAETKESGKSITLTDIDTNSATLKTNNGNATLIDKDGLSINVQVGSGTADITSDVSSLLSENGSTSTGITLDGTNTAATLKLSANKGNISQNSGSKVNVSVLNAETKESGKSITLTDIDTNSATLKTNNGNATLIDKDGLTINVNTGSADATITTFGAGVSSDNGISEANLIVTGDNKANVLTLLASSGNIAQSGGTIAGITLKATTSAPNNTINLSNTDFSTAVLTSKNGDITLSDSDGLTLTVDAGNKTAAITSNTGGSANNSVSESGIALAGTNKAGTFNLNSNAGNITQNAGATLTGNNLVVKTTTGNVTLDTANANNVETFTASTNSGNVTYRDVDNLSIASVNLNLDNNSSKGNLTFQTQGSGNISQTGALGGINTLSVKTDKGNVVLNTATNDAVNLLAESNEGDVNFKDANNINVSGANLNLDNNSSLGDLSIQTSSGDITQSGIIRGTDTLTLRTTSGNVTLALANIIRKLDVGTNAGLFRITNSNGFQITGGNMDLDNSSSKGDLALTATTGEITQANGSAARIIASELVVTGNATLNNSGNNVQVFSANGNNVTIAYTDSNGFNLAQSNVGSHGTLNLETKSGNIDQNSYSGLVAWFLQNRDITSNGGLTADTLNLTLGRDANASLTSQHNHMENFSLNGSGGCTQLVNDDDLKLGKIDDEQGILEVTLLNGHDLTQSSRSYQAIEVKGLKVTMVSSSRTGGDFTLTNENNNVRFFSGNASGAKSSQTQGYFVDGHDGFALADSDMNQGDLSLTALKGGDITQAFSSVCEGSCSLHPGGISADEFKVILVDGGDAVLYFIPNSVNSFSANASNSRSNDHDNHHNDDHHENNWSEDHTESFSESFNSERSRPRDLTGNTQVWFNNNGNLNIADSDLGKGDLVLKVNGNLFQSNPNGNINQWGIIKADELKIILSNNKDATLNNSNMVNGLSANILNLFGPSQSQILFTNAQDLNLAQSLLKGGDLWITMKNGADLTQNDFGKSSDILHSGGILADELRVDMVDGGDANLSTQDNFVNTFSANATLSQKQHSSFYGGYEKHDYDDDNAHAENNRRPHQADTKTSLVEFSNQMDLNLANSNLQNGDLSLIVNGDLVQTGPSGNITEYGMIQANEFRVEMKNNHDATLNNDNRVEIFSANATGKGKGGHYEERTRISLEGGYGNDIVQDESHCGGNNCNAPTSQIRFTNVHDLNLAKSDLGQGDLEITMKNGANLTQTDLVPAPYASNLLTSGGITGNELSLILWDGGDADLTTQENTVNVFAANTRLSRGEGNDYYNGGEGNDFYGGGENDYYRGGQGNDYYSLGIGNDIIEIPVPKPVDVSVIQFKNVGNLNLAHSDVGKGELYVTAVGDLNNQNLNCNDRNITENDSTLFGNIVELKTLGKSGSIDLFNNVTGTRNVKLTTANDLGDIHVHENAEVSSFNGSVYINTNGLTLDGYVDGQLVQLWPWGLTLSTGVGGGAGSLQLSQQLINHINSHPKLGLNDIMFGHKDYTGAVNLGLLNMSNHPLTNVTFNAPRVFESTPNSDAGQRWNLIMAPDRNVYFTAGADKVADWATAPGGISFGDNSSFFADLDIKVSGSGLIHVKLGDYVGIGNSFAILTGGGNKAFINVEEQDDSKSLKNLAGTLSLRAGSVITNEIKGNAILLPGNPVNNLPDSYGNVKPVIFLPNQSF